MKLSGRVIPLFIVTAVILSAFTLQGCNRQKSRAKATLDQYLKAYGVRQVDYQTYATDPTYPNRAYFSVIVTWNHADHRGQLQKEYLGYLLDRDGDDWKVENKSMPYTTDKDQAVKYLSGKSK